MVVGMNDEWQLEFTALFEQEFGRQVRLAHWIVDDPQLAREIAQETFARALARWPRLRRYDDPIAWLRTVTVRQAIRTRDRRARERPTAEPRTDQVSAPDSSRGSTAPAFDDEAANRLTVRRAISALPTRQRAVIVLHYLEGLPVAEVAGLLGVASGTVKAQLSRAREKLRSTLSEDHAPREPPAPLEPDAPTEEALP